MADPPNFVQPDAPIIPPSLCKPPHPFGVRPSPGAAGNQRRLTQNTRMSSLKQSLLLAVPDARAIECAEAVEKSRVSRCPAPAAPGLSIGHIFHLIFGYFGIPPGTSVFGDLGTRHRPHFRGPLVPGTRGSQAREMPVWRPHISALLSQRRDVTDAQAPADGRTPHVCAVFRRTASSTVLQRLRRSFTCRRPLVPGLACRPGFRTPPLPSRSDDLMVAVRLQPTEPRRHTRPRRGATPEGAPPTRIRAAPNHSSLCDARAFRVWPSRRQEAPSAAL
jgi:hypothetical protein